MNEIFLFCFKGIIALAVEANQNATWRDFMYMVVLTSRAKVLKSNNYFENKAGFLGETFEHEYVGS